MCVIVVKKKGKKYPTNETLKNCWNSNPDGAGFMIAANGVVRIRKGFMEWDDFISELSEARATYGEDAACVMHFRIATHGKVSPECCHPFPLSDSLDDLRMIEFNALTGIAHNGVIPDRSTSSTISDTMDYIANFVYPLSCLCKEWTTNVCARKLIDDTLCSKLAVLHSNGKIDLFGDFQRYDGCLFSNGSYKKKTNYISPYEMFEACEYCENFRECETYGQICLNENDAWDNCIMNETLFEDEKLFSIE